MDEQDEEGLQNSSDEEKHSHRLASQGCHLGHCHGEQTFSTLAAYEHHYETNHRYICQACGKFFPSEKWLDLHIREVHDILIRIRRERGEKTYQCFVEGCERLCSSQKKREMHLIDKHQYPRRFNFAIVLTGNIPVTERMKQVQREKKLWESREQGRQKVHPPKKNAKNSADMDIEQPTPSASSALATTKPPAMIGNRKVSLSSEPGHGMATSTRSGAKKKAFQQHLTPTPTPKSSRKKNPLHMDQMMDIDPAAPSTLSQDKDVHKDKDMLDMEIDLLQQSMSQLMVPRSVTNRMLHSGSSTLMPPWSHPPSAVALWQQRFIRLWLARSTPSHRIPIYSSSSSFSSRNSTRQSRFYSQTSTLAESTSLPSYSPAASTCTNTRNTVIPSNVSTPSTISSSPVPKSPQKRSRKRPKLDWTPEADALLLDLRLTQDKKWLEIGQVLGREPATCMTRFESSLNPALRNFWTEARDQELDRMVTGNKSWSEISQKLGVHRLACMERWRQLGLTNGNSSLLEEEAFTEAAKARAVAARRKKEKESQNLKIQQRLQELQQQQQQPHHPLHDDLKGQDPFKNMQTLIANLRSVGQVDEDFDRIGWNSLLRDEQRYGHYRSWKRKGRLDAISQLYLMNPGWSAKEETVLIQFVLKNGLDQWESVAKHQLGGRFTPAECRTCWKNLDMPVVTSLDRRDPSLQHYQGNNRISTSSTPSITEESNRISSSNPITGRIYGYEEENDTWTPGQQHQFWHLWNQHGLNWKVIADGMGSGMTIASCQKYYADITKYFRRADTGSSNIVSDNVDNVAGRVHQENEQYNDQGNDSEFQKRVRNLARMITQDFTQPPAKDLLHGEIKNTSMESNGDAIKGTESGASRKPAFVWEKELSVRLQAVVRHAYKSQAIHLDDINWLWVAKRVHPKATSRMCKNHWKFLHNVSSSEAAASPVVWPQESIRKLEEGIRLLGPKKLGAVRDHFLPHLTKDDVTRQWFRISDKATLIDEEEYYQLLKAVKKCTKEITGPDIDNGPVQSDHQQQQQQRLQVDWAEVEAQMGPKSGWRKMPCKRVWESSFQHLIQSTRWTKIEDNTLLRMVKFVGRDDWFSVARALQSGKSAWQCRLRWCQLLDPVELGTSDLFVKGELYC
ncbi:hypothetical protein BGZ51_007251 [Haplosporangium sp. Z 767]|nr:hypothetical protein BGZ51_007251 [Haplosporangium sp. Z 767]